MSLLSRVTAVALGLLVALIPVTARAQSADAQRYLLAASRLYENLEYERALDQLRKARGVSGGVDDDVTIALYEGIILSDMGKKDEAVAAFREGLYLKPEAKLPVKVAPKIEQLFLATKNDVLKELQPILAKKRAEEEKRRQEEEKAKQAAALAAAAAAAAEAEKQRLAAEAEAKRKADAEAAEQARLAAQQTDRPEDRTLTPADPPPDYTPTVKKPGRSVPVAPIVLGGVAIASAGVAGVFGYLSANQVNAARSASFQSETVQHLNQANTNALIANVGFGVAGAAAIAAVISVFVGREAPAPVEPP